jgi:FtsP/CotA-like multicopper oxidase with cupredoxin domain
MPPMDIADVAYDRFLANGNRRSALGGRTGRTVRLRIINGSATTYFHLEFAGGPMTIIAADGMDVEPVTWRLLIGVAETYDVLSRPGTDAYEFRATAHDGSGHASVWLGGSSPIRRRMCPGRTSIMPWTIPA